MALILVQPLQQQPSLAVGRVRLGKNLLTRSLVGQWKNGLGVLLRDFFLFFSILLVYFETTPKINGIVHKHSNSNRFFKYRVVGRLKPRTPNLEILNSVPMAFWQTVERKYTLESLGQHWFFRSSHHLGKKYYSNFLERLSSNVYQLLYEGLAPMAINKNQNPGGRFGANRKANSAHLAHFHSKWARLAVLFSW